jgi:CubicO group peptidase (beta-lactamase class C family)
VSAPERLSEQLDPRARRAQSEWRLPSLSACVFRDGEVVWECVLGLADVERQEAATPEHAYRVGSITKTFTAVAVLQLREAGLVDLDAALRSYVPEVPVGPTVRHALSHLSGLQREPPGEIWETMKPPSREELLAGLEDAELVLRPGERWHYSNLAVALLGEVVTRAGGGSYEAYLRERILEPLGLTRTQLRPDGPCATPYFVEPYADRVRPEPDLELTETTSAAGWLWSTPRDLARWADFLATGDERVLAKHVLDEMARVQTMADVEAWTLGWGLGLELYRSGDRVLAGHGGAMPGFLAAVCVQRAERTGAAVLTNTSAGALPETLAVELACTALDELDRTPPAWQPQQDVPEDVEPLLGRWWSEGDEIVFVWAAGRLRADVDAPGGPTWNTRSFLERDGDGRWRVVEGHELGELLRVVRDDEGAVTKLYFATYPLTRYPSTFG